jgi:hypothetical protein
MLEPLFESAAQMWTTLPPSGFGVPTPTGIGNGPIGPPTLGPPSYNPGLIAISPQGFAASSFTRSPVGVGTEPLVGLPVPSLLAAVAMRRGQPQGPTTDQEIEDFIYDALELLPGTSDVEVRCEGGRATLTGSVPHKRAKHDVGEIAWAIPVLNDVQNNLAIASRRRSRGGARESETGANVPNRKQS